MPYKISYFEDEFVDKTYRESLDDLNRFYEISWVHHLPSVTIVDDRKMIDLLRGTKTEPWLVAWAEGRRAFILDRNKFEEESNHKYSDAEYYSSLKHELSHTFYHVLSGGQMNPIWLCEGVAIYTSGQNKEKRPITCFRKFLGFYEGGGSGVYAESGFAIEILIKKFKKQKLLDLVKGLKSVNSPQDFIALFVRIYSFEPTYEKFNEMLKTLGGSTQNL